jgi:hypothetical protein
MASESNRRWEAAGLCMPGGLLIGLGIGIAVGQVVAGVLIGLGAGFVGMAVVRAMAGK